MLTPVFQCTQDDLFVILAIKLSAICKVMEASFDINGTQFTFHCRPYYLRLKLNESLQEGKGERATYDLESNTLTVYLPKAVEGQPFTQLDNVAYLIATDKQRNQLVRVVGAAGPSDLADEYEMDAEEEEYVQELRPTILDEDDAEQSVSYGFADNFSGLFRHVDADIVSEMVSVPNPEQTPPEERRRLRLLRENGDFDEDAVLVSFEDADGEVRGLLQYVPAHMKDFLSALQSDEIVYAALPSSSHAAEDALEEEEATLLPGGDPTVEVWAGNVAEFKRPLIEVTGGSGANVPQPSAEVPSASQPHVPRSLPNRLGTRLATPRRRPHLVFTEAENEALIRMKLPRLLFPPSTENVAALTADLLFTEAYDDIFTDGSGCSESVWTLCALSPSLSYLDAPDTVYDACLSFARRALVYPLHRHFALVQRVFAVTGARLLLGRQYVVRALLRVRAVLSHSEHRHVLSTIFLDPIIGFWMNHTNAEEQLAHLALEIHEHVSRTQPVTVTICTKGLPSKASALLVTPGSASKRTLEPLTLLSLNLPFS